MVSRGIIIFLMPPLRHVRRGSQVFQCAKLANGPGPALKVLPLGAFFLIWDQLFFVGAW